MTGPPGVPMCPQLGHPTSPCSEPPVPSCLGAHAQQGQKEAILGVLLAPGHGELQA